MAVDLLVTADGAPLEYRGVWRPPSQIKIPEDFSTPHLLLGVEYSEILQTDGRMLVKPWQYRVTASVNPPTSKPVDPRAQQRELAHYKLKYAVDGGQLVPLPLIAQPPDPNWDGLGEAAAILPDLPASAKSLDLRLYNLKSRLVSEKVYFVGENGRREDLFRRGKQSSREMALDPKECWEIRH